MLVEGVQKGRPAEPADELRTLAAMRGEPFQYLEGLPDDEAEPASGKHVPHGRARIYLLAAGPMETQSRDTFCPALEDVSELIEEVGQVRVVTELVLGKGTGLLGMKGRAKHVSDDHRRQVGGELQAQDTVMRQAVEPELKLDGAVPTHRLERTEPTTVWTPPPPVRPPPKRDALLTFVLLVLNAPLDFWEDW